MRGARGATCIRIRLSVVCGAVRGRRECSAGHARSPHATTSPPYSACSLIAGQVPSTSTLSGSCLRASGLSTEPGKPSPRVERPRDRSDVTHVSATMSASHSRCFITAPAARLRVCTYSPLAVGDSTYRYGTCDGLVERAEQTPALPRTAYPAVPAIRATSIIIYTYGIRYRTPLRF